MVMDDLLHNNNDTSLSFLTKGSQVEVTSNEDGFNGVWYAATVIHPPPSISSPNHRNFNNLVYVEYHDLLSEDGSSNRLREYANISYVRPSPVCDSNPPDFQLNDVVDAFYRDGWWTGVITTVVDSSNFVVTFRNRPDEIQFSCSDLRVHKKWVGGKWVQPQKQVTSGWMFTVGKKVEVSFKNESLRDVWFPATVLKNSGKTFLVEYQQLGAGDEAILHKVAVDYNHIRPSPPHLRDKNFVLLEKVDAYYDFGWWCGVITKELADNRYNVFFKHTNKQREFVYSRVRPHMEWKGGKWFNISQGGTTVRTIHSLIDNQIEQAIPIVGKQFPVTTSIMKRKLQKTQDSDEKTSPNKEVINDDSTKKKEDPSEKISPDDEVMNDDSSKEKEDPSENISPNNKATMNDDSSEKIEDPSFDQSEDSEVSGTTDQAFSRTENLSHGNKVHSKQVKSDELKAPITDSSKKRGRLTNELKSLQALTKGSEVDLVKRRTKEIVEKKDATKDFIFVVMGLQCHRMTVSQGNTVQNLPDEKALDVAKSDTQQPGVPHAPSTAVDQEGGEGDTASVFLKRKRGRPPKTPVTVNHEIRSVVASTHSVVEADQMKEVGSTTCSGTKSLEDNQGPVNEEPGLAGEQIEPLIQDHLPNESTEKVLHVQLDGRPKKYSARKSKRPKRRTISINAECPAQVSGVGFQDTSKEEVDGRLEKDLATEPSVGRSMDTVPDDQPISRFFEGKQHSAMDGPEGTMDQSSTASEGWLDSLNLSFIRSKALWKTLDSLEAFRMLPQKPHFRPLLEGVKEGAREGLAIGSMVTFSTMFDKTFSLKFDDPRSTIEDCLETLVELENNGFEVEVIRERLNGLLLIKDKHEEWQVQSKEVVEKIEEHNVQANEIEEEIEEINRRILELEERMKQALLKKDKRIAEISAMEAAMTGIEQEIRQVGVEFVGLAAAPFVV